MNASAHDTYPTPAHGWTCFHCGETFTQMQRARDHFGRTPDARPGCVIKAGEERGLLMELRRTEDARDEMQRQRDAANSEAETLASQLSAWRTVFPGCDTARDLFNKYDSMEGRALAAEQELASWKAVAHDHSERLKVITGDRDRLHALINTPHTQDFLEAVKFEMPHQRERWGVAHDEGKNDTDWVFLVGFLLGKAAQARKTNHVAKAKHHAITAAAACGNLFLAITGESTAMRPGREHPMGEQHG